MTREEGGVRPRHVVSALAVGAVAGFWAAALVGLGLLAAFGLAGSAMPPSGINSWTATIGAGLGAVLAGLFYVNVIAWLPGPIVVRSVTFGAIAGPLVAGISATAHLVPGAGDVRAALPWIVAFAFGTALATPAVVRGTLFLTVRSTASLVVLPPVTSAVLILVVIFGPLRDPATAAQILAQAPALVAVEVVAIVALGVASWTVGIRPPDQRPGWFRGLGRVSAVVVALTGVAMVVAAAGG